MPNWCHTRLEVSGTVQDVGLFVHGLGLTDPDWPKEGSEPLSILDTYHPAPEPYDSGWVHDNWGSKWSDCHTTYEDYDDNGKQAEAVFSFDSAWSPLSAGFVNVSRLFPSLRFELVYDEEGGFFKGAEVFQGGAVVFSEIYDPEKVYAAAGCEPVDWDNPASVEKWEQFQWNHLHDVAERASVWGLRS